MDSDRRQIQVMRQELKNIRSQIRGLRAKHEADVAGLVEKLAAATSCGDAAPEASVAKEDKKGVPEEEEEDAWKFKPVGHVRSWYKTKNGTPRQPTICADSKATLDLTFDPRLGANAAHALEGLEEFSHVWILFVFHQNQGSFSRAKVAPPRLGGTRVGLFSTRSPHRPNPVGLTLAKVEAVEGTTVQLSGHDLLDGTPVLDIKPYIPSYDNPSLRRQRPTTVGGEGREVEEASDKSPLAARVPTWVGNEAPTAPPSSSGLHVIFTARAERDLERFSREAGAEPFRLRDLRDWKELRRAIEDILSADPRSVYRKSKCCDRLYFLAVDSAHCTVWFDEQEEDEDKSKRALAEVLRVKPASSK